MWKASGTEMNGLLGERLGVTGSCNETDAWL